MKLPPPKSEMGYSDAEVRSICRARRIPVKTFWKAFGAGNTCAIENNEFRFYECDVERALWKLRAPGGIPHLED